MTDLTPDTPAHNLSDPAYLFVGADGLRAGWSILIFLAILTLLMSGVLLAAGKLQHKSPPTRSSSTVSSPNQSALMQPKDAIFSRVAGFAVVLLASFIMSRIEGHPNSRFGLGGTNRLPQFLQGLFWGFICLSLLISTLYLSGFLRFDGRLLNPTAAIRYGLIWSIGFILVGLFEEYLFRGYIQYTLARGLAGVYGALFNTGHRHSLGFWTAAGLLSLLFGYTHKGNPGESPFGLASVLFAGLVFCLALYRTGSLWWAIGFHAAWDWAQSFLYGVADSGTMIQGHLYATHPVGPPILSGGLTGPEGSILLLPALAVAVAAIFFTLPRTNHPGAGLAHPDTP